MTYYTKLKHFVTYILFESDTPLINKDNLLVPEPYYTSYIFSAFMGVMQQWMDSNCKEYPAEIAQILSTLNLKGVFIASGSN